MRTVTYIVDSIRPRDGGHWQHYTTELGQVAGETDAEAVEEIRLRLGIGAGGGSYLAYDATVRVRVWSGIAWERSWPTVDPESLPSGAEYRYPDRQS